MIMYTDTNVGCYDFFSTQRAWLRSDEHKVKKVNFLARLQNREAPRARTHRRTAKAAG